MGLVAEYEIGCDALPLVPVAAAVPDARIELEIAPGEGERPVFIVHVTGDAGSVEAVEDAFASTAFVGECARVGREGDSRRYTVHPGTSMTEQLGDRLDDLDDLRALYSADFDVGPSTVTPRGWHQTGHFADRAAFDELRTFWQRNDVPFRLDRLTLDDDERLDAGGDGLTDAQREALRTATEMGYFEIPRTATLADVAARLDVSASSVSERLRRAQATLVERHVDGADRRRSLKLPHD